MLCNRNGCNGLIEIVSCRHETDEHYYHDYHPRCIKCGHRLTTGEKIVRGKGDEIFGWTLSADAKNAWRLKYGKQAD